MAKGGRRLDAPQAKNSNPMFRNGDLSIGWNLDGSEVIDCPSRSTAVPQGLHLRNGRLRHRTPPCSWCHFLWDALYSAQGPNINPSARSSACGLPGSHQRLWGCLWWRWSWAKWGTVRDIDQRRWNMTRENDFWRMCKGSHNTFLANLEPCAHVCRWKMSCKVRDTTRTD